MKKTMSDRELSGFASEAEVLGITLKDAIGLDRDGCALLSRFAQELHRYLSNYFRVKIAKELAISRQERDKEIKAEFRRKQNLNSIARKVPFLAAKWNATLQK